MLVKPPLSSFESAVPCKIGDTLTPEQQRRLFNGDTAAFAAFLASLTPHSQDSPNGAQTDDARESA